MSGSGEEPITLSDLIMQSLKRLAILHKSVQGQLLESCSPVTVQIATLMKVVQPQDFSHVEYPERRRLRGWDKVPQPPPGYKIQKMSKMIYLMRGPETVNNTLIYGDYGIQALQGGRMRHGHYEMIRHHLSRNIVDSRMFGMWRVGQTWQSVTKKGQGHRMGGGKGSIDRYEFPVKAQRIIVEIGGELEEKEAEKILKLMVVSMPFKARIVSRKMMEEEKIREAELEKKNVNPFNFKYCLKHNFLGINTHASPYDYIFHGKYR